MKTREKRTFLLSLAMILFFGLGPMAQAAHKAINCTTNFGEKSFTIQGSSVAFQQQKRGRNISSVLSAKTRTVSKGFRKTLYDNGYKHLINIKDQNNFDSNNDFLAVTSPKGHKVTFPLNCSQAE